MTVKSWPWAGHTQGDAVYAPYTNKWFADFFQLFLVYDRRYEVIVDTGHQSFTGGLQVNDTTGDVTVQTGVGIVDGMMFTNDAAIVLTPDDTPSIRTDLVIVRKNITGPGTPQTVDILLLKGTNGNNTPPALTQNTTTWEVALAEVDLTPGPVIDAVRNTGRIVRTPLGPGYQSDMLVNDDNSHTPMDWNSLDADAGGVTVVLGPGKWAIQGSLQFAPFGVSPDEVRGARLYNQTLTQTETQGGLPGDISGSLAPVTIAIPRVVIDCGVITTLELQFFAIEAADTVYGSTVSGLRGKATTIIAERVT